MFSPVNEKSEADKQSRASANETPGRGGISLPAPAVQMKNDTAVNNDKGLEHEADIMGNNAPDVYHSSGALHLHPPQPDTATVQRQPVANPVVQRVSLETLTEIVKLLGLKIAENSVPAIVATIAGAVGLSYSVTWGILSAGIGWVATALLQKLMQAKQEAKADDKPEVKTDISGIRKTGDSFTDEISTADKNTTTLNLIKPVFPDNWSSDIFLRFKSLNTLIINNTQTATPPKDRLAGLLQLPLKRLELIRAEFMDEACYSNLGKMRGLDNLSLARTITKEKSPGASTTVSSSDGKRELRNVTELAGEVLGALKSLMENGLKTLDLRWCSALTDENKKALKELAERHKVALTLTEK
ncbi:hypothetical protein [Chitinophaga sp.]|uniref:hypothetical protein n=1 Tax=Chitinophaga sp. TaxID=1869181 RepID=UPI002F9315F3